MDKHPSLRTTKRSGHHQKGCDRVGLTLQQREIWDFGSVNKKLLTLEAPLQSLKQGFFLTAALGGPFCKVQKAWVGIEYLFSREKELCVSSADTSAGCASVRNSLYWLSTNRKLQSGQEQPGACYPFTPALSNSCPGVPYNVTLPHWWHTSLPGRWGHLRLHLGHTCELGACTDHKSNS